MPTLLFDTLGSIKGVAFDKSRRVGSVMQTVRVYNLREVDELVILDVAATRDARAPDFALVDETADECFMPLTVGGGVRSVEDVVGLLRVGADKVSINTAAIETPDLVREAAQRCGSQCVVVSIDARRQPNGDYEVFKHSGMQPTGRDPVSVARQMESLGAGEILLTSVDRDGTMTGYDLELIRKITHATSIPVIASGGAGGFPDMAAALLEGGASAVAAASIFHFTQQTPLEAKAHLRDCGIEVRL